MKIAIPTSDRINVYKRTGRALEFAICELVNGSYEFVEFIKNPHEHSEQEEHEHSHHDIVEALKDCDALLVIGAGTQFKKDFGAAGIPLYKTYETELKEAIITFAEDILGHERL